MTPARARAVARGRALALVADLWANGLTGETYGAWLQVPDVAELLPASFDPDLAAVQHQRLSWGEVFPFESAMLHADGLIGGDVVGEVRDARGAAGLGPPRELEVDHLAEELRLLAFLAAAEADALRDGVDPSHVRRHVLAFLDQHLLRWLPTLVATVEGVPDAGLYAGSVRLVLELVLDWRSEFSARPAAWQLPPADNLLDDERTGLKRISQRLCVPALAGGMLTAPVLRWIGRDLDLPGGFGKRWQVLESILAAAAHYSAVPQALDALEHELDRWEAVHQRVDQDLPEHAGPWRARIAGTRQMLAQLRAGAVALSADG
ncbi:MAG: molecular chaperone TorD family protein [Alphaproteobacteria bacterium]|nr:molecular chaperone TorD family protein [Alphaproteobacteria bacterium]